MGPKRLSILGIGLLGGSLGLATKALLKSARIIGYAHRPATLQAAIQMQAVDEAYDDPARAVHGADLVVLCTPVGILGELLDRIAPALAPGAVVTDVGSTKRDIVAHAVRALQGSPARFVGSHPIAGSEKRGVEFAQAGLFKDALCVLTPDSHTDAAALGRVESFWRLLGMRTVQMSADEHDRRLAEVSHLPHAVAAALVTMQSDESLALAGKGFLDLTRIAGGDGGLWRDIFLSNRDNLRDGLRRLRQQLDQLLLRLEPEQSDALQAWLDAAARKRQAVLDRKAQGSDDARAP